MMKKCFYLSFILLLVNQIVYSQTGINTRIPLTTLTVAPSNAANPSNTDGVIIPRVTLLNTTDVKAKGLLVFYDVEDAATDEIEKGFYYWDGIKWIPFFAMNKVTTNRTIVFANCKDSFDGGSFTLSSAVGTNKTLGFVGPVSPTSVASTYTVNASGELVIGKKGYYDINSLIALNVVAVNWYRRDAFELTIMVNGVASTIKTAYGFPNYGADYDLTTGVTLSGVLPFNVNDKVTIRVTLFNTGYNGSGPLTSITTKPVGSLSNITLRYMGDF